MGDWWYNICTNSNCDMSELRSTSLLVALDLFDEIWLCCDILLQHYTVNHDH